ncbi:MAG: DEAD/DEAH box helicase [Gemmataceae bacterium]
MLREEQIDLRRERAKSARLRIENRGKNRVFSDYTVTNPDTGGSYSVSIRGFDVGDNSCTCPDFKQNTLGTCKHIEAVTAELRESLPAHLTQKKAPVTQPQVYLHYGSPPRVGVHLPTRKSDRLAALALRYFDEKGLWSGKGRLEAFIAEVHAVPETVTVAADAMQFIEREVERTEMLAKERDWLDLLDAETLDLSLLPVPLYDYQTRGAIFLACRGRAILGDDMGLGKTVQTLAAVELLVRERGIGKVLVVAPSSVKYQWESEIARFTKRATQVIEGGPSEREAQYREATFYRLVNYEQVVRDLTAINAWMPDLIVLDEAQRIKNWESKTSKAVKRLASKYAFVLTGTPLENRLEELYSIVEFVDAHRFGPAFQFLNDHRVLDSRGNLKGYRNLDTIREKLEPVFLRRTRGEVLTQLPARTDSTAMVELSDEQRGPYEEQRTTLARLATKGFLTDLDRKRILACLVNLRTICDSLYLYDHESHISPKLDEFAEIVPQLLEGDHKLVVFSQWETMAREAATVLNRLGVDYALLHGGLSGKERKAVLDRFQSDDLCRVFLSTDAGGVGLNLQVADTVVNLELPWNPAILDQRIARVHRMGQERPVRVLNFITRGTIEERVQQSIRLKKDLFEGLFTGGEDDFEFDAANPTALLGAVRELLSEAKPEPMAAPASAASVPNADLLERSIALVESVTDWLAQSSLSKEDVERLERAFGKLTGKRGEQGDETAAKLGVKAGSTPRKSVRRNR